MVGGPCRGTRPCGFPLLERTRRGGARRGGRAGVAFQPDRDERPRVCLARCTGRRPVAGSRRRDDRAVRGRPVDPVRVALTADPTTRKRRRLASAAHRISETRADAFFARTPILRVVGRYARPDRTGRSFPRPVRRRSWGSVRSTLRRFAPADRWCTRFRATGPACRSCRLVRPIDFRRVAGCSRVSDPDEARRPGIRWRRLSGFAPIRDPHPSLVTIDAILPWALPLAGLAGTSFRASWRARPRPDHQPPGMSRRSTAVPRSPIRSRALRRPSRHDKRVRQLGVNRRRGGP